MNLLLLHGALGSAAQLRALQERVGGVAIDLSGHGSQGIPPDGIRFEHFIADIDRAFDEHGWREAHLFGYSMGGYAAMLYAAGNPGRVKSVITLGTKFLWNEDGLKKELRMLDPDAMEQKVPAFTQVLADAHGAGRWKQVVRAIARSMIELAASPLLGPEECARIKCPALLCVGEMDTTAVPADTRRFASGVNGAEVFLLPGTPHPFDRVNLDALLPRLHEFWRRPH